MPDPGRPLGDGLDEGRIDGKSLVSPHGFDAHGPVPALVTEAAKRIAELRVKHVTQGFLMDREIEQLFHSAAIRAEWERELYEAVHTSTPTSNASPPKCAKCDAPLTLFHGRSGIYDHDPVLSPSNASGEGERNEK